MLAPMKRAHASTLVIGLALFLSSGCSIKSLVKQIEKESDKQADLVCGCLSGAEQDVCYDLSSGFNWGDCEIDAFKEDRSASKETLNCMLDEMKDATDCIESNLDCEDSTSIESCYATNGTECPELPSEVQEALNACSSD
jgi:hypothetical protein